MPRRKIGKAEEAERNAFIESWSVLGLQPACDKHEITKEEGHRILTWDAGRRRRAELAVLQAKENL